MRVGVPRKLRVFHSSFHVQRRYYIIGLREVNTRVAWQWVKYPGSAEPQNLAGSCGGALVRFSDTGR